jgi:hypothetical protein
VRDLSLPSFSILAHALPRKMSGADPHEKHGPASVLCRFSRMMTVHHPASYPWQSPADPSPTTPLHCSNLLAESFVKLHSIIHPRATTEFVYRYSSPKEAYIITSFLLISSPSSASGPSPEARAEELATLQTQMAEAGMESVDLSDDEFAKSHVRHMVGGKKSVEHERIFRFGEWPYTVSEMR